MIYKKPNFAKKKKEERGASRVGKKGRKKESGFTNLSFSPPKKTKPQPHNFFPETPPKQTIASQYRKIVASQEKKK